MVSGEEAKTVWISESEMTISKLNIPSVSVVFENHKSYFLRPS